MLHKSVLTAYEVIRPRNPNPKPDLNSYIETFVQKSPRPFTCTPVSSFNTDKMAYSKSKTIPNFNVTW